MKIAQFTKLAIFTALIAAGSLGTPIQTQAASGSGGGNIIVFDIVDSVVDVSSDDEPSEGGASEGGVDQKSIEEDHQASTISPDPEYKYISIRR